MRRPSVGRAKWSAAALACMATGTSAWVSLVAAWERGGDLQERIVWAAFGIVLLLTAHLLPALSRGSSLLSRSLGAVLWAGAMAATSYGHAMFFVEAQQNAGSIRAQQVPVTGGEVAGIPTVSGPGLTALATQQAQITEALVTTKARLCKRDCREWNAKIAVLEARLSELRVAITEGHRSEQLDDERRAVQAKEEAAREAVVTDPVTRRVADALSIKTDEVDLAFGIGFGLLLECVACFCWLLVISNNPARAAQRDPESNHREHDTAVLDAAVTEEHAVSNQPAALPVAASNATSNGGESLTSHVVAVAAPNDFRALSATDAELALLTSDIAGGLLRPTVAAIRRHLKCSQAKAMALRKHIEATHRRSETLADKAPLFLVPRVAKNAAERRDRAQVN